MCQADINLAIPEIKKWQFSKFSDTHWHPIDQHFHFQRKMRKNTSQLKKKITKFCSYQVFGQFAFYFFAAIFFFSTGFLYVTALAVVELALQKRLVSNSQRLAFDFNLKDRFQSSDILQIRKCFHTESLQNNVRIIYQFLFI